MPHFFSRLQEGNPRSITAMLLAVMLFSVMDTLIKALSAHYPPLQIAAMRGALTLPLIALWIQWRGAWAAVWQARWESLGFQPILDAWTARTNGLDGPCVARLGHETINGVAEGVAPDGALRLRTADGALRLISAGDVFFGADAHERAA